MHDDQGQPPKERRCGGRLPLQLPVRAELQGEAWPARTEDLSHGGCRLTAPAPLPQGSRVRLLLDAGESHPPLRVSGVVTWTSGRTPWTHGVAFATSSLEVTARWLMRLLLRRAMPGRIVPARASSGTAVTEETPATPTPVPLPLADGARHQATSLAAPTAGSRPVGRLALVTRRARRRPPG